MTARCGSVLTTSGQNYDFLHGLVMEPPMGKTDDIIRYRAGATTGVGDGSPVVFGAGLTAAECATAGGFSLFC
jgi:hypothetical protein